MLGFLHACLESMVIRYNGADVYKQVLKTAGYDSEVEWDTRLVYPDNETYRLFRALGTVLGQTSEEVWENFGVWMCIWVVENGWEKFLNCIANDLHEFLDNLSSMHFFIDQIAFQAEMRGPSFKCEAKADGSLRLHYYSVRKGLFPLAKGMVKQAARTLFGVEVSIVVSERSQERRNDVLTEHVVFTLESADDGMPLAKPNSYRNVLLPKDSVPKPLAMSVACFCRIFPTHVCFNKALIIEHCGDFILKEFSVAKRRMTKISDLLQLVQPDDIPMTFKAILTYLNSLFIFQFKESMARNENSKSGKKGFFSLKGQMILVNNGNSLLYLNSPHVINPKALLDSNLYLNDMQRHDATRDLIMLNQTRITQQEINKKLEESAKRLRRLYEELDGKKKNIDVLLYECIPNPVANALRKAEKVNAQEFTDVTCLCSDMPFFSVMSLHCSSNETVSIMTEVFAKFDRLVELNDCFKVYTIMDNYMVIGGAPKKQSDHVERILNLAIGMVIEAKQIRVTEQLLPLILRIGIHSGSVVGGIIGHPKMRYCVFSDTVNVCKRLTQHTEPGKILVTNAAKLLALKSVHNNFVFTNRGYLGIGNNQATCTFYLEKNTKKTVWEIIQKQRPETASSNGHIEFDNNDSLNQWKSLDGSKKAKVTFSQTQNKPKQKMDLVKRLGIWKEGVEYSKLEKEENDSAACSIL
ncbi:unnamed protein product [Bursaphelenchus okinawaensis]|uniref:guanylate cyclase n=1 Tax=Bursaphelenchus okinawaensis TaxID=465554 RepID=A0A811KRN5_9BILA|nr:unnamed protein product [Bursaphelenchus okinawaensis]CAG9112372.1 unnamed protein product [Bursaphelenchus okinawaensis]